MVLAQPCDLAPRSERGAALREGGSLGPGCRARLEYDFRRRHHRRDRSYLDEIHEQKLPTYFAGNGTCSSKFDPSIAPAGKHVAFWWPWAPYDLDGDPQNWDKRKAEVADRILSQWREFAPNLTAQNVIAKAVFSPLDIERHCINMVRGSHHVGAYMPSQLGGNRPTPDLAATPRR